MNLWLLVVAIAVSGLQQASEPQRELEQTFVVIVHADHPGTAIQRERLADIFLRKVESWGDGRAIEAVDQSLSSWVRSEFSREVLGLAPGAVLQHWQAQLQRGTGLRPPPVKESDAEVVEWVGGSLGRIGYVRTGARLGAGVKAVSIQE